LMNNRLNAILSHSFRRPIASASFCFVLCISNKMWLNAWRIQKRIASSNMFQQNPTKTDIQFRRAPQLYPATAFHTTARRLLHCTSHHWCHTLRASSNTLMLLYFTNVRSNSYPTIHSSVNFACMPSFLGVCVVSAFRTLVKLPFCIEVSRNW
jgi:hypothetical protein